MLDQSLLWWQWIFMGIGAGVSLVVTLFILIEGSQYIYESWIKSYYEEQIEEGEEALVHFLIKELGVNPPKLMTEEELGTLVGWINDNYFLFKRFRKIITKHDEEEGPVWTE